MSLFVILSLVAVVVFLVLYVVLSRFTRHRVETLSAQMEQWHDLPVEERFARHTDYTERLMHQQAAIGQIGIMFAVGIILAGAVMFTLVGHVVNENDNIIDMARYETLVHERTDCLNQVQTRFEFRRVFTLLYHHLEEVLPQNEFIMRGIDELDVILPALNVNECPPMPRRPG